MIFNFCWCNIDKLAYETLTDSEKYQTFVQWAENARGQNPCVFDSVTEWIRDDSEWSADKLSHNKQILMQDIFARFKEQNTLLRTCLWELEPSGLVNSAIFPALDRFDDELSGISHTPALKEVVANVFADFSAMEERHTREFFAGNKTGACGTDSVDIFGHINFLKDCDAAVQWALFMPDVVEKQQNGFKMESFEYKKMPAMRFIGFEGEEYDDLSTRLQKMSLLDSLTEYKTELDFPVLFMHHYGLGMDIGEWHGVWGRFMKADTPVPEGFLFFDFLPENDGHAGLPYLSQFAFATFSGNMDAMHQCEGFDSDAMYDVTRNRMLGEGVCIPYPDKYWTAEVFLNGLENYSTAYMFSAEF